MERFELPSLVLETRILPLNYTRSLWFQTDLNRRRSPLQGDALPTELWNLLHTRRDSNPQPIVRPLSESGLEPPGHAYERVYFWVNDGLRSRYLRCHKPALYRLSYNHHFVLFTRLTDWLPFRKWGHPVISGLRGASRLRSGSSGFSDQRFYQVSLGSKIWVLYEIRTHPLVFTEPDAYRYNNNTI